MCQAYSAKRWLDARQTQLLPGGGIKSGEQQWQACKKGFSLPVRVLSRLFVEGLRELFKNKRSYSSLVK